MYSCTNTRAGALSIGLKRSVGRGGMTCSKTDLDGVCHLLPLLPDDLV